MPAHCIKNDGVLHPSALYRKRRCQSDTASCDRFPNIVFLKHPPQLPDRTISIMEDLLVSYRQGIIIYNEHRRTNDLEKLLIERRGRTLFYLHHTFIDDLWWRKFLFSPNEALNKQLSPITSKQHTPHDLGRKLGLFPKQQLPSFFTHNTPPHYIRLIYKRSEFTLRSRNVKSRFFSKFTEACSSRGAPRCALPWAGAS